MDAEAEGFAQFVEARQRALQRTAWLLTGDWALAEDLVQTALVRSWPRWERIRRRDDPEIYVRRAMVNSWASWRRRRWWGERATEAVPDSPATGDVAAEVAVRVTVQRCAAVADRPAAGRAGAAGLRRPVRGAGGAGAGLRGRDGQGHAGARDGQVARGPPAGRVDGSGDPVNGMDRQLRDLLEAAAGEPPHRVSVEAVRRRVIRRRVVEFAAGAVAVAAIAVIIPVGIGALGRAPRAINTGPAAARMVTSRHYGYTETLPAGWRLARQATRQWNGTGGPGYDGPVVDLFAGPRGVQAWAFADTNEGRIWRPTRPRIIRASRAAHPCSPPQTNQAITIGGAPARLLGMQCPAGSGFLVEIAVTVHNGTGFVFASQTRAGGPKTRANADRAAFRNFLAGIRLPP